MNRYITIGITIDSQFNYAYSYVYPNRLLKIQLWTNLRHHSWGGFTTPVASRNKLTPRTLVAVTLDQPWKSLRAPALDGSVPSADAFVSSPSRCDGSWSATILLGLDQLDVDQDPAGGSCECWMSLLSHGKSKIHCENPMPNHGLALLGYAVRSSFASTAGARKPPAVEVGASWWGILPSPVFEVGF